MISLVFLALCLGAAKGFQCDFSADECGFVSSSTNNNIDWEYRLSGGFMSLKAPYPRSQGGKASLSTNMDLFDKTCINFRYKVSGKGFARLSLYVDESFVFESGRKQNAWKKSGELYLVGFQGQQLKVEFTARVSKRFKGSIAIDDVDIHDCDNPNPSTPVPPTQGPTPPSPVTTQAPPPPPVTTAGPTPPPPTQGPTPPAPVTTQAPPPPSGSCGVRPSSRIVGGTTANPGDWPWQAQLRTTSGFPYCGASLVDSQWVVTAAHCVEGSTADSIIVRLGAHHRVNKVGSEQDFKVLKVISHTSYHSPKQYSHDIALLKLDKPATLNDKVNLVCLPDAVPAPTDGTKCWITGWGRLASGGATPNYLQQASVPIASRARCDVAYPNKIHDSMICAGLDQGGIDSCQGDSGGPMVCETGGKYYLHGATSWGYGCADAGKFGVYAKVKYLLQWVKTKMANN